MQTPSTKTESISFPPKPATGADDSLTTKRDRVRQILNDRRKANKAIPPDGSSASSDPAVQVPPATPKTTDPPPALAAMLPKVIPPRPIAGPTPKSLVKTPVLRYVPISVDAESIEMKPVRWLWKGRLAQGKLTVFDGDPGTGKGITTIDIAARLSRGDAMPDGSPGPGPSNVLWVSSEENANDTLKPRLAAAGADMSRVRILSHMTASDGKKRGIMLPSDLPYIQREILHFSARVVVFDPFLSFAMVSDTSKDRAMRPLLEKLQFLAEDTDAAIILVRHLNKTDVTNAIYRGLGSIATIAICRTAFLFAKDPDQQGVRVMACTKNNLCEEPPSLRYTAVGCTVSAAYLPKPIETVKVKWLGESNRSANALLAFATSGKEQKR